MNRSLNGLQPTPKQEASGSSNPRAGQELHPKAFSPKEMESSTDCEGVDDCNLMDQSCPPILKPTANLEKVTLGSLEPKDAQESGSFGDVAKTNEHESARSSISDSRAVQESDSSASSSSVAEPDSGNNVSGSSHFAVDQKADSCASVAKPTSGGTKPVAAQKANTSLRVRKKGAVKRRSL
jgi:hypothetical protein